MGLLTWIRETLLDGQSQLIGVTAAEFWNLASSTYVRELAFQSAKNMVAKALAKCEFKTYRAGKEVKNDEYYLWNVEPNRNQNSSVFLNKLISKLFETNECLVIETDDKQLLVADTYRHDRYAVLDDQFYDVAVGDYVFRRTFGMSDVLFFQLNNDDIRKMVNGLHASYGELAEYAQKAYKKSRGQKGLLKISAKAQGDKNFDETLKKMMNERFKTYYDADSAVLPITEGYEYSEPSSRTTDTTRDIRALIDDVFVFTARSFGIPPALLLGELADTSKAIDTLLTFCIDPLCDMLQEEINRKRNGKSGYLAGNMVRIDTKAIKHVDLLGVAVAIDKLISSGAFCINDIRELVGDAPIDEPWAWKHWMTRNYLPADEALHQLGEGG